MLAYVLISDWQLGLLALLVLPGVAWAMERLGGSMRRAATRGMQETGDLSVVLSEAMDGRRIIKAYGLEDHSHRAGGCAAGGAAEDPAQGGAAARRRRAHHRHLRRRGGRAGAVLSPAGRSCMASSPSTPLSASSRALLLAQQPVRNLSQLWPTASAGIAAASRMFAAIDARPAIVDRAGRRNRSRSPRKAARCASTMSASPIRPMPADPGARRSRHSRRQEDRAGGAVGRRQEHHLQSAAALL